MAKPTEEKKPIVFSLQLPGYDKPTDLNKASLISSYDALAEKYGISDPSIKQYYMQLIDAAEQNNLRINSDGTLSVTGSAFDLRNQYKDVNDVPDQYKYDGKAKRGVAKTLNEIGARSHGMWTSNKTEALRNDTTNKAKGAALFLKAVNDANNAYTAPTPETPKGFNASTYFNNIWKNIVLGNKQNLTEEQRMPLHKQVLDYAIADAKKYYDTVNWTETPFKTVDSWIQALQEARNSLEDGLDQNDNPALIKIGYDANLLWKNPEEPAPVTKKNINSPWLWNKEDWIQEQLKQFEGQSEDYIKSQRALLEHEYDAQVKAHNQEPVDALETKLTNEAEAKTNKAYEEHIAYDESDIPYTLPVIANYPSLGITDAKGKLLDPLALAGSNTEGFWKQTVLPALAINSGDSADTDLTEFLTDGKLGEEKIDDPFGYLGQRLALIYALDEALTTYIKDAPSEQAKNAFISKQNALRTQFRYNSPTDPITVGYITPGEGKQRVYLQFMPGKGFQWIAAANLIQNYEKNWKKNYAKQVPSEKNGGILKAEKGNKFYIRQEVLDALEADDAKQKQELASRSKGERIVGIPPFDNGVTTADGNYSAKLSGSDIARLSAIGADILSLFMPSVGSAVTGVASTLTNIGADVADGSWSGWDIAKSLGLDALSIVPIFGVGAKYAKIARAIRPLGKVLTGYALATGIPGLAESVVKAVNNPGEMTVDDWRNVASVVQTAVSSGNRSMRLNKLNKGQMHVPSWKEVGNISSYNPFKSPKYPNAKYYVGSNPNPKPYHQVNINGQKVHLSPEDYDKLRAAKTAKERKKIMSQATDVVTNEKMSQDVVNGMASDQNWLQAKFWDPDMRHDLINLGAERSLTKGNLLHPQFLYEGANTKWQAKISDKSGERLSTPSKKQGGPIEFAKQVIKFSDGGPAQTTQWTAPAWWKFMQSLKDFNLEDYLKNKNTKAANTINNSRAEGVTNHINNAHHWNPTVQERFNINTAYTADNNYKTRDTDFQTAAKSFFDTAGSNLTATQLVQNYNAAVDSITNLHSTAPAYKYQDEDVSTANTNHRKLYASQNSQDNLGWDEKQLDIYGPTTYLRLAQQYENEFDDKLKDSEFLNRVHSYKINGKDTLFGVMANGHIKELTEDEVKRYNTLKQQPTQTTSTITSYNPNETVEQQIERLRREVESASNGTAGRVKPDDLKQNSKVAAKRSPILPRPDRLTELGRLFGTLATNRQAFREQMAYKPLLTSTWRQAPVIVHGDMHAKAAGQNAKAQGLSIADQPLYSDASLNAAIKAQATAQGQALENQAKAQDQAMIYQTTDQSIAAMNADRERENINYNSNINTLSNWLHDRANIKANYRLMQWGAFDNYLAGLSKEFQNEHAYMREANRTIADQDANRRAQALSLQAYYNQNFNWDTYNTELDKIYKDQKLQVLGGLGYHNIWGTRVPQAASGRKLSHKKRTKESGSSDFNKAIDSSKKAFYNAVQLNYKYRKR